MSDLASMRPVRAGRAKKRRIQVFRAVPAMIVLFASSPTDTRKRKG